ncbi:hypothetical protein EF847_19660 [Actinobacteria bacterium YIM 96077]|uniref:Uncharacterized protein n=1 Tax=Phytoactinopolyspora halophila TaxID=1981511 RepID=A0A329QRP1_9ACTN|nr:hypothetical protein [Phytoactinopolyspora halophila]AYY14581.1 hypothetical protein EF847_19660 [Actinobacteria bacterium YIM 96077]RAW14042.1 hypothetical protein DPM12_11475 [Phytoactinopolyspora halophila]
MWLHAGALHELAHRLAERGPAAVEDELAELEAVASAAGVSSVLLAIMGDGREPAIARQRAFAQVVARLNWPREITLPGSSQVPERPAGGRVATP